MKSTFFTELRDNVRAFLKAPFEELPPQYGDTVPPELRVFEAEMEEAQRHPRDMGEGRARPSRREQAAQGRQRPQAPVLRLSPAAAILRRKARITRPQPNDRVILES